MSAAYRWGSASFAVPAFQDESVLAFVDYDKDRAVASFTITREVTSDTLAAFVFAAQAEVTSTFPGWKHTIETETDSLHVSSLVGTSPDGPRCLARGYRKAQQTVYCFTALGAVGREAEFLQWVRDGAQSLTVESA